jgi:DNA-binding transcriptional LysR family regulator
VYQRISCRWKNSAPNCLSFYTYISKGNFGAEYGQAGFYGKTKYIYRLRHFFLLIMDTELLKTFMEVSRTRHFGRAAENLYLTQSAVSFRIRQLESVLGVELFSRQRNNIQLTEAGEKLMPLAENSVLLEQRIRQEIAVSTGKSMQLMLAATPNLWDCLLPGFTVLLQSFPDSAVNAQAHSSGNLVRQLSERTLDVAFMLDAPKVEDVVSLELLTLPLYLVASANAKGSWQELLQEHYVQVDWGVAFHLQLAQELRLAKAPVLQTNTGRIALEFLLHQDGAAFLPQALVQPYVEQGRVQRVAAAPQYQRTVFACFHAANSKDELIRKALRQFSAKYSLNP